MVEWTPGRIILTCIQGFNVLFVSFSLWNDMLSHKLDKAKTKIEPALKKLDLPENYFVYLDYCCDIKAFRPSTAIRIKIVMKQPYKEYVYYDSRDHRILTCFQIRRLVKRLSNLDPFEICKFANDKYTEEVLGNLE